MSWFTTCLIVLLIIQEEDKAKRKAELTIEYEEKVAAKKADNEEEEGVDSHICPVNLHFLNLLIVDEDKEEDEDLIEYREQMAEIDQEEFVDEEEDEEEESETDAMDRIRTSITEKFEEVTETISNIQVSHDLTYSMLISLCWSYSL